MKMWDEAVSKLQSPAGDSRLVARWRVGDDLPLSKVIFRRAVCAGTTEHEIIPPLKGDCVVAENATGMSTPAHRDIPRAPPGAVKKFRIPCRERSPQRSRYHGALISKSLVTQRGTERRPFPTKNHFFTPSALKGGFSEKPLHF